MALEYAIVTCEGGTIGLNDIPHAGDDAGGAEPPAGGSLAHLERNEILNPLDQFRGNKIKVAEYPGINRKTLREKMPKYGLIPQST